MIIKIKYLLLISLLWLGACRDGQDTNGRQEKSFNAHWDFAKVYTQVDQASQHSKKKKVQDGNDWKSQFFIEHIDSENHKDSVLNWDKVLDKELRLVTHWDKVCLPHAAHVEDYQVKKQWEGICYYRKNFLVDKNREGKKLFVKFEGAMQTADVWVNGNHLKRHLGGYLPFSVDISSVVCYGQENNILVRLDNRDNPLIPPGKPLENLDFCYFHGLYRNVKLINTEKVYITDEVDADKIAGGGLFVTYPKVSDSFAEIHVKSHIKWEISIENIDVVYLLKDKNGVDIGRIIESENCIGDKGDKNSDVLFEVSNPHLWSCEDPYLYDLVVQIWKDNAKIDERKEKIGIRRISITREKGFTLNGSAFPLVGTNRHMDFPWVGNAASDEAQYRDLIKIKKAGFNTVRLGHYPQAPSVYDVCDSIGLLVINPMPGWQFFNKDTLFCERTWQTVRDMIRRDRNHPCVVMWETILNESWPPKWWKDKSNQVAHEEYPGDQCFTSGDMYGYNGWDVLYNDWSEDHTRPNASSHPGFIREYGDYEFGGHLSTTRITHTDGEKALLQNAWNFLWSHNKHRGQYPWTIGDANWSMYDYNRGCSENICYSGISGLDRRPKFAYYFYSSQVDVGSPMCNKVKEPELFIANYWTPREGKDKVVVFSNVDEVELRVNGQIIERRKPDGGPDTPYAKDYHGRINGGLPFDGGNANNLKHPPFTFNNVVWEKGKLEALGYINGKLVAESIVNTPEKPTELVVEFDTEGLLPVSNGSDVLFVRVKIQDINNSLCVMDNSEVSIVVDGAEVVSPSTRKAESGMATFLVKVKLGAHKLKVTAVSGQLKGQANIRTN